MGKEKAAILTALNKVELDINLKLSESSITKEQAERRKRTTRMVANFLLLRLEKEGTE